MAYTYQNKQNLKNLYESADLAGRKFLWLSTITGAFFVYSLLSAFAASAGLQTSADSEGFALFLHYALKGVFIVAGALVAYYLDARMISPSAKGFATEFSGYLSAGDKNGIEKFTGFRQVAMWTNCALLVGMLAVSFLASYKGPEVIVSVTQKPDNRSKELDDLNQKRAAAINAEAGIYTDKLAKLEKKRDDAVEEAMARAPKDVKKSYSKGEEYGNKEMRLLVERAETPFVKEITTAQKSLEEASKKANARFDEIEKRILADIEKETQQQQGQSDSIEFILRWCGVFGLIVSLFGTALWSLGETAKEMEAAAKVKNSNGNPSYSSNNGSSKNNNQQWGNNQHHWTNP